MDPRTGSVIRYSREDAGQGVGEHRSKWAEAIERVLNRPASSAEKFEAGIQAEKNGPRDLDELLRKKPQTEGMESDSSEP